MNRTLSSLAVLGLCTVAAPAAHAQSVPLAGNGVAPSTMNYSAMPAVARDPKGIVAPFNGTAEEAYIKEEIRGAGYSGVNSLMRDSGGTWHARAYKGPTDVLVAVDRSGHRDYAIAGGPRASGPPHDLCWERATAGGVTSALSGASSVLIAINERHFSAEIAPCAVARSQP
jgi:hypothetical protein